MQWQAAHQGNVAKFAQFSLSLPNYCSYMRLRFDEMLNEVKPLSSGAAKIRIREYMRSPSLQRALRVHRRDLRIMTSASASFSVPPLASS